MRRLLERNAHKTAPWGVMPSQQQQPQVLPAPASARMRAGEGPVPQQQQQGVLRQQPCHARTSSCYPPDMRHAAAVAAGSVLAVVAPSGAWATAVLVSASRGYLVTNAHLVVERAPSHSHTGTSSEEEDVPSSRLRAQLWHRDAQGRCSMRWRAARAVYVFNGPLDLAVLQLEDSGALAMVQPLSLCPPSLHVPQGQPVTVLGFPLFAPRSGLGPCASAGMITKVRAARAFMCQHARSCRMQC